MKYVGELRGEREGQPFFMGVKEDMDWVCDCPEIARFIAMRRLPSTMNRGFYAEAFCFLNRIKREFGGDMKMLVPKPNLPNIP